MSASSLERVANETHQKTCTPNFPIFHSRTPCHNRPRVSLEELVPNRVAPMKFSSILRFTFDRWSVLITSGCQFRPCPVANRGKEEGGGGVTPPPSAKNVTTHDDWRCSCPAFALLPFIEGWFNVVERVATWFFRPWWPRALCPPLDNEA